MDSKVVSYDDSKGLDDSFQSSNTRQCHTTARVHGLTHSSMQRPTGKAPCVMMHDQASEVTYRWEISNARERGRRKLLVTWRVTTEFSFSSFCRNPVGHSVRHPVTHKASAGSITWSLHATRLKHLWTLIFNLFFCVSWFCFEVIRVDALCFPTRAYKKQSRTWWRYDHKTHHFLALFASFQTEI